MNKINNKPMNEYAQTTKSTGHPIELKPGYLVLKSQFQDKEIEYLNNVIQKSKKELEILFEELKGKLSFLKKNNREKEYLEKLEETVNAKDTYIADMKNTLDNYTSVISYTGRIDAIPRPKQFKYPLKAYRNTECKEGVTD